MTSLVGSRLVRVFKGFDSVRRNSKGWEYDFADSITAKSAGEKPRRITRKPPIEVQLPGRARLNPRNNTGIWLSSKDLLLTINNKHYYIRYSPHGFGTYMAEIIQDREKTRIFLVRRLAMAVPVFAQKHGRKLVVYFETYKMVPYRLVDAKAKLWSKKRPEASQMIGPAYLREPVRIVLGEDDPRAISIKLGQKLAGGALLPFLRDLQNLGRVRFKPLIRTLDYEGAVLLVGEALERGAAYWKKGALSITSEVNHIAREYGIKSSLSKLAGFLGGVVKYERDPEGIPRKVLKIPREVLEKVVTKLREMVKVMGQATTTPLLELGSLVSNLMRSIVERVRSGKPEGNFHNSWWVRLEDLQWTIR